MRATGWDDSLATGDRRVDSQHKALFVLIDELHDAIVEQRGQAMVEDVIARLTSYAHEHFRDEEALMEHWDYPGLVRQRLMHREFAAEVKKMRDEYFESGQVLSLTLSMFLRSWLTTHIRTEDKKIVDYIRAREAAGK